MNFFERTAVKLRVLFALAACPTKTKAKILDANQTADAVISGKSLIRLGDGEMRIMRGLSIGYQDYTDELFSEFCAIRDTAECLGDGCPYLLCVPKRFMSASSLSLLKKRKYASSWAEARLYFKRKFPKSFTYGDAFVFSVENRGEYERIFTSLCQRNVIFVHNDEIYASTFARQYGASVHFIPCPKRNAHSSAREIEMAILDMIASSAWKQDEVSVIISAGPCAKALVLRLSLKGYHAIDAGHCFDYPLEDMK